MPQLTPLRPQLQPNSAFIQLPSLESVGNQCFQELQGLGGTIPSERLHEQLQWLAHIYGRTFVKALEIAEQKQVAHFQGATSGRQLFKVCGRTQSDVYLVLPPHYCSCQSFFYDVVSKSEAVTCKHQLAARLAVALNLCAKYKVSDAEIAELLAFS